MRDVGLFHAYIDLRCLSLSRCVDGSTTRFLSVFLILAGRLSALRLRQAFQVSF